MSLLPTDTCESSDMQLPIPKSERHIVSQVPNMHASARHIKRLTSAQTCIACTTCLVQHSTQTDSLYFHALSVVVVCMLIWWYRCTGPPSLQMLVLLYCLRMLPGCHLALVSYPLPSLPPPPTQPQAMSAVSHHPVLAAVRSLNIVHGTAALVCSPAQLLHLHSKLRQILQLLVAMSVVMSVVMSVQLYGKKEKGVDPGKSSLLLLAPASSVQVAAMTHWWACIVMWQFMCKLPCQ